MAWKNDIMPLLSLWSSNPEAVNQLNIEQVVTTAGDGQLLDNSPCSHELREFLTQVSSDKLAEYTEHCLVKTFNRSGMVLQDVVNELGRRLDYLVENGKYQGTVGSVGYDGIWRSPEGMDVVVEVKTTDAYRISLDTIAMYRRKLFEAGKVHQTTSVLIVVGRKDTGELEAQVRGSRHAWDMRLISADALLALVKLKESTEGGATGAKIRSILVPMEYTRLDALVDVMFTAAKDVETTVESDTPLPPDSTEDADSSSSGWQFTDPQLLQAKRNDILAALGNRDGIKLIKRSRALYWDATHCYRVACTVSKRYTKKGTPPYWYAFHPKWDTFLAEAETAYMVLGCLDLKVAFVLPLDVVQANLSDLSTSGEQGKDLYWHIKIR